LYALAISNNSLDNETYAFEPNPETFTKLKANLSLNKNSENVKPLQIAVGNADCEKDFMISSQQERSSFYKFSANFGSARVKKIVKVKVQKLDSLSAYLPPPQHLKIDAEGSEAIIIEGAAQLISKYKPMLYIEPHGTEQEEKISQMLSQLKYKVENNSGCYVCSPIG
jgi:FkbM family methyltransferase